MADERRMRARRSISRRRLLGGSAVLLAGFLAACSGGGETTQTETPPTPVGAAAPPTPAPSPTPNLTATATARAQKLSLRLPTAEPPTLDPALATDHASVEVAIQLFEGLTEIDQAGQPTPLGADKWEVADDGRTYTFTLKGDRLWSDGSTVTADDYVWAWRRAIDPRTASDYAALFYPIKNAVRIHTERLDPALLGVTARDPKTLVVNLEEPLAHLPRLTALVTFVPLKKDALERFGDRWTRPENIVGNGPFRLIEWVHDKQLVLERSPTYPGSDRLMPGATFKIYPDDAAGQVLSAYESGDLDVLGTGATFEIPPGDTDRILNDSAARLTVKTTPQSGTLFLAVNHRKPHLQDGRVRKALGQVVERDRLLKEVLHRVGSPAVSLIPDGIVGRDESRWPGEDVGAARALMAEAGFPDGKDFPPISFAYNVSPQWQQLGEYLRQRYQDTLGIELKPNPMEWTEFLRWRRGDDWPNDGDLARGGWLSDYEDPYDWYNLIWDSREDPSSFNAGWKNDDYDGAVREAAVTFDRTDRAALYGKADEVLASDYPSIPIFHYASRTLVRRYVHGFEPERVLSLVRLKRVQLDEER